MNRQPLMDHPSLPAAAEGHRLTVTEAQLRWAQFHHRQKAKKTKEVVERLMMSPASPSQVDGAQSDDDTSEEDQRPKISRGRRALLRVSKRAYERRRKIISEHGFKKMRQLGMSFEEEEEEEEEEEDALATIFAEHCVITQKSKRRRLRQSKRHAPDTTTQFDMAFRAMMFSLAAAAQRDNEPIEAPTKRWTRPEGQGAFLMTDYSELNWGIPNHQNRRNSARFGLTPIDRGASWLMHLPASRRMSSQHPSHQKHIDGYNNDCSQQAEMDEINEQQNGRVDPRNSSYQQQQHAIDFSEQEEKQKSDKEQMMSPFSQRQKSLPNDALGFVQELVKQMESAARIEPLVTADGKLHKPTFARLVLRYLGQIQNKEVMKSPVAMARARRSAGSIARRRLGSHVPNQTKHSERAMPYNMSSGFVRNFIAQIEASPENGEEEEASLITLEGKLDTATFEKMVTSYLARAADQTLMEATRRQYSSPGEKTPRSAPGKSPYYTSHTSSPDLFEQMRDEISWQDEPVSVKAITKKSVPLEATSQATTTEKNHSQHRDSKGQIYAGESIEPRTASCDDTLDTKPSTETNGLVSRMAGSVSDSVGGFLKRLHTGMDGDSISEKDALAAFRKSQSERHAGDETSSQSTFRALPTGLMNAMKSFRRNPEISEAVEHHDIKSPSFDESIASSLTRDTIQSGVELPRTSLNNLQERILERADAIEESESNLPFIDTDGSEVSFSIQDPSRLSNLLLSPTILTKRHQQAMRAIESRNWDQVAYLISANPWLAEMSDIKSGQYLLHGLAYYGAGEVDVDPETGEVVSARYPPAPDQINTDMVRMHASAVHKFDQDGNLPLHMAAASGNLPMIRVLGERFPGGSSVRNEDGMLPLHLSILSCATMPTGALNQDTSSALEIVRTVISYFPAAVGVTDNEGNLPIHIGASVLTGGLGVDIIFLLLDEADKQLADPQGVRFRNKIIIPEGGSNENEADGAESMSSSPFCEDDLQCTLVKNDRGENPLTTAIKAKAGWEVIEAIACSRGGAEAAMDCDADKNNALHLLASNLYYDPEAIFSILKVVPATASSRNSLGMLPIEVGCMQSLPADVLVAIVLEDLPIDIDETNDIKVVSGKGSSWWYLTCECDDFFANIVEDVISFCSVEQARALCLVKNSSGETLLHRASPICKLAMETALRVAGRFEYDETRPISVDNTRGLRIYDAYDHGDIDDREADGKKVSLRLFSNYKAFEEEISILRQDLDFSLLEEILALSMNPDFQAARFNVKEELFMVSVEEPSLSLRSVVDGMLDSEECQRNSAVRQRYAVKVFAVLRVIVRALRHLHSMGLIHGKVNAEHCCKYGDRWKLRGLLGCQKTGQTFKVSRFSSASPPECFESGRDSREEVMVCFKCDFISSYSVDSWSFGKMCYEVLVGRALFELDPERRFEDDQRAMLHILNWNDSDCSNVRKELRKVGVVDSGTRLVASCLDPNPLNRPTMGEIMSSNLWKDLKNLGNLPRTQA